MPGLSREIWISQLQEHFVPSNSFMNDGMDLSEDTTADAINVPSEGAFPTAFFNPSYPLAIGTRTDIAKTATMHDLVTEPKRVQRPEEVELSYNKLESVIKSHRKAMEVAAGSRTLFEIAPAADSVQLPVIAATGAAAGGSPRPITLADIAAMAKSFDDLDYPQERSIVLTPFQFWGLVNANPDLANQYAYAKNAADGVMFELHGFKVRKRSITPNYTQALAIQPYGTLSGASRQAAIAYCDDAWYWGMTTPEMFDQREPAYVATVVNFFARFGAARFAERGVGAIVSVFA